MEVGERFAYRARGIDPLVEVELVRIGTQRPARVQVRFVDEDAEGRVEWVPPARLKCPWRGVADFVAREERWERLSAAGVGEDDPAFWAATTLIEDQLGRDVAETEYRSDGALRVCDRSALAGLLGWPEDSLTSAAEAFEEDGDWLVPWETTLRVAQRLCVLRPEAVLARVDEAEAKAAREATYGKTYSGRRGQWEWHVSAQDCAARDQEAPYGRPARDLTRSWCGQEAVQRHDELAALRSEVHRLGGLVERSVGILRSSGLARQAKEIEHELGVPVDVFRGDR